MVERKVGEIEVGYVMVEGRDVSIELLAEGLAKVRGEKINCEHIDEYKNAEIDAEMGERGLWYQSKEPKEALRYLKLDWKDRDFF